MIAACGDEEEAGGGEVLVSARPHKEFLRDLLLAQGIQKTPGSELEDLLARYWRLVLLGLLSLVAISVLLCFPALD